MNHLPRFHPRSVLVLVLATVLFTPTARAQVVLKPKLQPKTKRVYHAQSTSKQILTLAGMDIETSSTQFVISENTIGEREADGTLRLVETNKKLQQEITIPGVKVSFDSSNPDKKAPLPQLEPILELLRIISKAQVTLVYDNSDQVVKVEGINEVLKDLDPDLRKSVESQIGADIILASWKNRDQRIPAKAVAVGDKWQHTTVMHLEAGQKIGVKRQYTYAGTVKQGKGNILHRITTKSLAATLTQDPPEGSPTKITASKLKIAKGTGEILIDLKNGVIVSESDTTQMKGTLTMEVNGMSLDGSLDLTIATQLKLKP